MWGCAIASTSHQLKYFPVIRPEPTPRGSVGKAEEICGCKEGVLHKMIAYEERAQNFRRRASEATNSKQKEAEERIAAV